LKGTQGALAGQMEVFQNQPNPFDQYTNIAFFLPTAQNVSLTIFDGSGKEILNQENYFSKGVNSFRVEAKDLTSNGILIYRIDGETQSIINKMIMIK